MAEPARQTLTETVALRSERFGHHDVPVDRVLHFPDGLIGFAGTRRFALLDAGRSESPFRCLVSLEEPDLGFVVCDPCALWPGYADAIPPPAGAVAADLAVLALVTVPADAADMTANLLAPLVIDCRSRTGRQLVLDNGRWSTRHHLLPKAPAAAG
jgi:flagellar assembly factor FliW